MTVPGHRRAIANQQGLRPSHLLSRCLPIRHGWHALEHQHVFRSTRIRRRIPCPHHLGLNASTGDAAFPRPPLATMLAIPLLHVHSGSREVCTPRPRLAGPIGPHHLLVTLPSFWHRTGWGSARRLHHSHPSRVRPRRRSLPSEAHG